MSQLDQRIGRRLEWRRDGVFSSGSTLFDGEAEIATLKVRGFFERRAVFEIGGRRWNLRMTGLFGSGMNAASEGDTEPVARFRANFWSGGVLSLSGDRELRWKKEGFFARRRSFIRGDDVLLRFERQFGSFRSRVWMTVEPAARDRMPDLDLLAGVGWFLMLREPRRSAH